MDSAPADAEAPSVPRQGKVIRISVQGAASVPYDQLEPFQGDLKSLSEEAYQQARASILDLGFSEPISIWVDGEHNYILNGHQRLRTIQHMVEAEGYECPPLPVSLVEAESYQQAKMKVLALGSSYGKVEGEGLYRFLHDNELSLDQIESFVNFSDLPLDNFAANFYGGSDENSNREDGEKKSDDQSNPDAPKNRSLSDRFLVPPFSILDTRQGYWQDRKRQWLSLGIRSEEGRAQNLLGMSATMLEPDPEKRAEKEKRHGAFRNIGSWAAENTPIKGQNFTNAQRALDVSGYDGGNCHQGSGTSIFDPVLCELAYRWFSPKGGIILDPFAGGSVRGIIASRLGRQYVGNDLREEQIVANRRQADEICRDPMPTWHIGDSRKLRAELTDLRADMVFSCPPYADLERYSEDQRDISSLDYEQFREAYFEIIAQAVALLKDDRFSCFVVGEVRSDQQGGAYYNFVPDTIAAFEAAGAAFYNEAILVTCVGTVALRAAKSFVTTRKLGKSHQNVLVFCKGDPRKATEACGEVVIDDEAFAAAEIDAKQGEDPPEADPQV